MIRSNDLLFDVERMLATPRRQSDESEYLSNEADCGIASVWDSDVSLRWLGHSACYFDGSRPRHIRFVGLACD